MVPPEQLSSGSFRSESMRTAEEASRQKQLADAHHTHVEEDQTALKTPLSSLLTVVVTTSPIPYHPSTKMLEYTIGDQSSFTSARKNSKTSNTTLTFRHHATDSRITRLPRDRALIFPHNNLPKPSKLKSVTLHDLR